MDRPRRRCVEPPPYVSARASRHATASPTPERLGGSTSDPSVASDRLGEFVVASDLVARCWLTPRPRRCRRGGHFAAMRSGVRIPLGSHPGQSPPNPLHTVRQVSFHGNLRGPVGHWVERRTLGWVVVYRRSPYRLGGREQEPTRSGRFAISRGESMQDGSPRK
jgi:hypothetical protein